MLELRLRAIPLFRDLPYDSLKSIAARLKRERYAKGAVIFRQEMPATPCTWSSRASFR